MIFRFFYKERTLTAIGASALLASTILVFGALQLYLTNINEFTFALSEIIFFPIIIFFIVVVSLSSVIALMGDKTAQRVSSLVFALGVLFWLQGNFILWDYGFLDGKTIEWQKNIHLGIIDTIIWLAVIASSLAFSAFLSRHCKKISVMLILIQTISLLFTASSIDINEKPSYKKFSIDDSHKYQFSSKKNIIILIFDSYTSDIFSEIISESPSYKDIFKGFTYFPNALGGYPYTNASVPLILTGQYYDNSIPIQEFQKQAFKSQSLPKLLTKQGYRVDIFPCNPKMIYYHQDHMSNIVKRKVNLNEVAYLFDIALFRYSPHFIKKLIYNDQHWFLKRFDFNNKFNRKNLPKIDDGYSKYRDLRFIEKIEKTLQVTLDRPSFKYYHLNGPHPPLLLNEKLEIEQLPNNRLGIKRQAKGMLELSRRFFRQLKAKKIFDDSMIIIAADHGFSVGHTLNLKVLPDSLKTLTSDKGARVYAIPLILIKPFNSKEDFQISKAPVTLGDIPQTIFSQLGLKVDTPGESMFAIKETAKRKRKFYTYIQNRNFWRYKYLPDMTEYSVDGFSWLESSWSKTGIKLTGQKKPKSNPKPIDRSLSSSELVLTFHDRGNARPYLRSGWSYPEKNFTWTNSNEAQIIFPLKKKSNNLLIKASIIPNLARGKIARQRVSIYANGKKVGQWKVASGGIYQALIPQKYLNDSQLDLSFKLPDATTPIVHHNSADLRKLGIAVISLKLKEIGDHAPLIANSKLQNTMATPLEPSSNQMIKFGANNQGRQYLGKGWSKPEKSFTWSNSKEATMLIPFTGQPKTLILTTLLTPYILKGKIDQQRVTVLANGKKIANWEVSSTGAYYAVVPPDFFNNRPQMELVFQLPDAVIPATLGTSKDQRNLALCLQGLKIKEMDINRAQQILKFGIKGNSIPYQIKGFHPPDQNFTWTANKKASLLFPITGDSKDLIMKASLFPYVVPKKLDRQKVIVNINGQKITEWDVIQEGEYTLTIPGRYIKDYQLYITFEIPDSTIPILHGTSADMRDLGVAFRTLVISPTI